MQFPGKNSTKRFVWITLLQVLLFFFLLESLLSILYYQKYGNDPLATVQWLKKIRKSFHQDTSASFNPHNQQLARPGAPIDYNEGVARETMESNHFEYQPWVQFKVSDYQGKYVNVVGLERKSDPAVRAGNSPTDTLQLYFFGGSTMFGFNVADQETIPSQFLKQLAEQIPVGRPIKVVNLGIPFFYSYQELTLFSQILFQGKKPAAVVFMDGLNDFLYVGASALRQPYFSYILRQVFNKDYLQSEHFHFRDSSALLSLDPPGVQADSFYQGLVNQYFENLSHIQKLADQYGIKAFYFCHPVPFYHYPNQQQDPVCDKDQQTRFDKIYPLVAEKGAHFPGFTFLGDMLANEKGVPFIDGFHFSPAMNGKIAAEMVRQMKGWLLQSEINKAK